MKYKRDFTRRMTDYFRATISDGGIPTFSGAATVLGADHAALARWRGEHPEFAAAYRECRELLSDCLMTGGLTKRFDSSLVRALLTGLSEEDTGDGGTLRVTVRVVT